MADITITIPGPKLTTGQYFKERHRQIPSGSWSAYTNRNNAPFTITGLSIGDYEFEFILVNADETHCPAVYRTYTLIGDYDCISFSSIMKEDNNLFYVELTYTLPPSHTDPACGWEIEYTQGNNTQSFTMATLPVSGVIKIPCNNVLSTILVKAQMCNGRTKNCHENDIAAIFKPACTPMSNVQMNITEVHDPATSKCRYYLNITFTQSVPATTNVRLNYLQSSPSIPAGDNFNGFISISPTATSFTKEVFPHFRALEECSTYTVNFIDVCGNGPQTAVPFCRANCFEERP